MGYQSKQEPHWTQNFQLTGQLPLHQICRHWRSLHTTWENLDSIIANGLEKRDDRSEVHLAIAVPEQGIKDIPVLKGGRCVVFVDTLALLTYYQCSLYSNREQSVLLVHTDRILPEHFQAVIDKYNGKEQRGMPIPPVVKYFLGRRNQPLPREVQAMTYLPPQAKLLIKNVQKANQMVLANSAAMEIDCQQRFGLPQRRLFIELILWK